jgi:hypothetical protein
MKRIIDGYEINRADHPSMCFFRRNDQALSDKPCLYAIG